ncbi:MAG: hypothetical protein HKN08_13140 [Gammaproteobacteria bacterium]|nr:hypothetical protein [Gammaproteobacteria bacterium]
MKVGFLFNHEQLHQIPHAISIAYELSNLEKDIEVLIITSSERQFSYIKEFENNYPDHHCDYVEISMPGYIKTICSLFDRALPVSKIIMLKRNLSVFEQLDALVVPEKTSLLLKSHFGLTHLKYILTTHGSGDRKFGFNKGKGKCDLLFLSGEKVRKRMEKEGVLATTESCIIGYPKFDAVNALSGTKQPLFENDRLTVVYNPHFSPNVSSWYKMGLEILEYFYTNDKYNLIFAPHIMLYTRKMHFSEEQKSSIGWVKPVPEKYFNCPHILIDTDSIACTDMTYTLGADIYMGDVSSQYHEFLINPRPSIFINAHQLDWEKDESYQNWHTGTVVDNIQNLEDGLQQAINDHKQFLARQQELFNATFELTDETSSKRAARAISVFLQTSLSL